MVAMLEALRPERVVGEDGVRPVAADGAHDVTQQLARVLEAAVRIAEHGHVLDAHEVGGGALLGGAALREPRGRQRAVAVPALPLVHST